MGKEEILENIRRNKPEKTPLPVVPLFDQKEIDLLATFKSNLELQNTKVFLPPHRDILEIVHQTFPVAVNIYSTLPEVKSTVDTNNYQKAQDYDDIDLAIIKAELGVADTGSIWISDLNLPHRVLPFLCTDLMVVIESKDIVYKLHHAYPLLRHKQPGYGVFISGPSKTADIEQAMVIGAHGPMSFTVLVTS